MTNDTAPAPDQGDAGTQTSDWEARYLGLQRVLSKRDQELVEAQRALERLQADRETDATELAEYRTAKATEAEEKTAREQFEALRQRFEPEEEPPTPNRQNSARDNWFGRVDPYPLKETPERETGFPI